MFIDYRSVKSGSSIDADICIIGSGAAGITLCREFLNSSKKIILLESGTFDRNTPDPHYEISASNLAISQASRVRAFGGTTTVWSGRWKEHDPDDFKAKDWITHSGWPITKEDLNNYYDKARAIFGIEKPKPEAENNSVSFGLSFIKTYFEFQPKSNWDWGQSFRQDFANSENINVYLGSHAVHLEKENGRIRTVEVKNERNDSFKVRAKIFVLAAGGIENARLLLVSDVGNDFDQVGRYYMDHPKGKCGLIELYKPLCLGEFEDMDKGESKSYAGIRLNEEVLKQHGLLNSYILIEPLYDRFFPRRVWRKIFRNKKTYFAVLRNFLEQAPDPEKRLTLIEDRDVFGMKKVEVNWSVGELDKRTIIKMHSILASELRRFRIGELRSPLLTESEFTINQDASHHIGTTRMGANPKHSVVDSDCKVHGIDNLFIAGSSVFTTGGYANPTATIVALALKLADHIKSKV